MYSLAATVTGFPSGRLLTAKLLFSLWNGHLSGPQYLQRRGILKPAFPRVFYTNTVLTENMHTFFCFCFGLLGLVVVVLR